MYYFLIINFNLINSASYSHRTVQLLSRRYSLTPSSFKHLDIGIAIGKAPIVQWTLGDNRGNQLSFYHDTWVELMERQEDVELMLQHERLRFPLKIHDLKIVTRTLYGSKMFKLTVGEKCLYMKPATIKYLFDLKDCIACLYNDFNLTTCIVNAKFTTFVKLLKEKNIDDVEEARKIIRDSHYYDHTDIVDCELLLCGLHVMLQHAITPPNK